MLQSLLRTRLRQLYEGVLQCKSPGFLLQELNLYFFPFINYVTSLNLSSYGCGYEYYYLKELWRESGAVLMHKPHMMLLYIRLLFSSVQSLGRVQFFETPWTAAHQASLSITSSWSLLKLMSTESVMPSNHLILCHTLLLLPSIFPSIRVFSNEPVLRIRWPKYRSFSFSINPSNEYPGLISFRMDCVDLLAVQGTPKSLLQHHSSKASVLRRSAFFTVQLSKQVQRGTRHLCPNLPLPPADGTSIPADGTTLAHPVA